MKVRTPSGRSWTVRRRWMPWDRKLRGFMDAMPAWDIPLGDDPISMVIGLIVLIILLPFILLFLIGLTEMLLGLAVLPLILLLRPLLRIPWTIEVRDGGRFDEVRYRERVKGWKASRRRIRELATNGHCFDPETGAAKGPVRQVLEAEEYARREQARMAWEKKAAKAQRKGKPVPEPPEHMRYPDGPAPGSLDGLGGQRRPYPPPGGQTDPHGRPY